MNLLIFIFVFNTIDFAAAGETVKTKASGTSINTEWHEIEVGDQEGHVIAIFENTQAWIGEPDKDTRTQYSRGTMDLNKKLDKPLCKGIPL